jgi:hypothetical protein
MLIYSREGAGGGGVGKEPNQMTVRNPGPLVCMVFKIKIGLLDYSFLDVAKAS